MTFEQMKELEPALYALEQEVISRNKAAKNEELYWSDVWAEIKPVFENSVGVYASHIQLRTRSCYDTAFRYLESLVINMS